MYYPVGWPKILVAVDVEDGNPVQILKHPRKELIIVIRERCVSLWHSRVSNISCCIRLLASLLNNANRYQLYVLQLYSLIHCYKQNKAALQKNGLNTGGLTSADGTILVVTVSIIFTSIQ